MNNVYNNSEYEEVIKNLKEQLFSMKKELGDTDNEYPQLIKRTKKMKKMKY